MKKPSLVIPLAICLPVCLIFGLLTGYGRLLVWFFFPGLQGMLFGLVLGFSIGAALAKGKGRLGEFCPRLMVVAGMLSLFYGGQLIVPAFVLEGCDPTFLVGAILEGHFQEVFTGASINSYTAQQGPLTPGWWLFMQGIDTLIFAVFSLISLGVGLDKLRSMHRIWLPAGIVAATVLLVLATTLSKQADRSGLLRDWQTAYSAEMEYLDWRENWIDASLREWAVEQFLLDTQTVDLTVMPQLGILRALGLARLGQMDAASSELSRSIESAKAFPGLIRVDMTRQIRVSRFIQHTADIKNRVDFPAQQRLGSIADKIPVPLQGDIFPYEGILK